MCGWFKKRDKASDRVPAPGASKTDPLTDAPGPDTRFVKALIRGNIKDSKSSAPQGQLGLVKQLNALNATLVEWVDLLNSGDLSNPEAQAFAAEKMCGLCIGNESQTAGGFAAYNILANGPPVCEAAQERLAALVASAKLVENMIALLSGGRITSAQAQKNLILPLVIEIFEVQQQQRISGACFELLCAGIALSNMAEDWLAKNVARCLTAERALEARRSGNMKYDSAKGVLDDKVRKEGTEPMVREITELRGGEPLEIERTLYSDRPDRR